MRKLLYSFLFFISSKSFPKRLSTPSLGLLCVGMFFVVSFANADTFYSRRSGDWNARSTWSYTSGGGQVNSGDYPIAGDIVHIEGGYTVTLTANAACATIDFPTTNNDNSIILSGYTLNVSGNISIPRSGNGLNLINVGTGTLYAASIDFPTTGSAVRHKITISTGSVIVTGNISTNSATATSSTIEFTGSGLLRVGGNFFSNGGGSLTQGTGTVELNGTDQSFKAFSFYNLTLAGSGTKYFTGTTAVANALVINSNVKADLGTVTHSAGTLTLASSQVTPTSWGSTSSSAQNKNDTYFANSGIINVSSSTCTTFSSVTAITNVLFGSINNPTAASSTAPYIYYSNVAAASVSKGQYYELTVKGYTNGSVNNYYTAFFDWNGDGDFADSGEGPYKIGTINSSTGTDGKATSVYLQIPTTAISGSTKMRIMSRRTTDYNSNACSVSGTTGQIQDYNITILDACVGNPPGNTLSTASSVCPNTPFTLSLQNTMAEGTSYVWQTSPNGNAPWTSATATPTTFFSSTFSANQAANTNVGDISLYGNDTSITGGVLYLTTLNTSYSGGFVIQKTPGININTFSASFDYKIYGGNGADGLSLSYASNIANNVGGGESGEGSGIVLQLDTYDNEGVKTGSRVRITYNGSSIFNSAIDEPFNLRTSSTTSNNVVMSVNDKGYLTLTIAGTVVVSNLALPAAYLSADKSNWKFKFSGRTGASNDNHVIDNVNIYYLDTSNSKSTFTTTQTVKTYYRVAATCGGTTVYSTPVMVDVISATINPMTKNVCTDAAFTITPTNGTDGTIPNSTTYTWTSPTVTGGLTGGVANNVASSTITGTLANPTSTAQTATYTVTPITGSCTGVPFTLTVTVNPNNTVSLTSAAGTNAQTVCINSPITNITYSTTGATGATVTGLPAGVTGGWSGNVVTISGVPTASSATPFGYTVTLTGGCGTVTATGTITVNPAPLIPSITKNSDVSCGSFGSITITGLSGNWTINQTGIMGSRPFNGTSSTFPIQDLIAGTHYFTVTNNATGCTSNIASITINDVTVDTEWDGSGWTNGTPDGNKRVTISSIGSIQPFSALAQTNIDACSLIITAGADVTVPSGVTLNITNAITSNGKLVFESGSSLLQGKDAVNTGDIVYKRAVNLSRYDVVYWSTPLTKNGFTMHNLSPNTLYDKYFYWNARDGKWVYNTNGTEPMKRGEGYNIRAPQNHDIVSPSLFTGVFTGVPNNGNINVTVELNKWNFLGNPYPSAIDADELILDTNKDVLGSLYFWTHSQAPQIIPGTNTYRYISSDYLVYNGVGSTRVNNPSSPSGEFKGYIAAGQGFFAKPTVSQIKFNNDLRRGSSENTQFYKTAKTKKIEKNRLWLNAANSQGAFKQMLIGYVEGATNAIDVSYDAVTMGSNSYVDLYSINDSKKLTIQGRALPFDNTEVIPLGFKCGIDATGDRTFTISIDHADGFFNTQEVYLEDKELGVIKDLRKENYTFTSGTGTYSNRFVLRYTNKTLGTGEFENLENTVLVSVKDKAINITSSKEIIKGVNVYNIGVELLYSNSKVNASQLQIKNLHSSDQVLLVKITLENGHTFSKKVIFSNL